MENKTWLKFSARQSVLDQIISAVGSIRLKQSPEAMESLICSKSNNEEEYLTFAASLLSKMREENKRIADEGSNARDYVSVRMKSRNAFQDSIKSYIDVMSTMQRHESAFEVAFDLVGEEDTNFLSPSQNGIENQSRNQHEQVVTQISPQEHNSNETCSSSKSLPKRLKKDSLIKTKSEAPQNNENSDCTVCFENPINSVLYRCGHMCMCHDCAMKHWHGTKGSACPICRAPIIDVVRTYKAN